MKTTKKLTIFIAFIALTLTSCSKDDDASVTFQEENPMPGFMQTSGFNFNKNIASNIAGELEMGFSFIPKVNGTINALVNKTHVPNSNLKVTIWDKVTGLTIATNYINYVNPGIELVTNIPPVSLQKNKEYIISVKTQFYYIYEKQNSAIQVYPVDSGNISITGSLGGDPDEMPNLAVSNSFTGDYSFIFKQTE